MTSTYLKAGVAIVLCTVAAYSFGLHSSASGESERRGEARRGERSESKEARRSEGERGAGGAGPDIAAIGAALLRAAAASSQAPATPMLPTPGAAPVERAREVLESRMANAPYDPRETARMEDALRALVSPSLLGGATAEVLCGSTICRIDVSHQDDQGAQKATGALATRVPKMFGATAIYPRSTGERTVYVAKDSADLMLEPLTTTEHASQVIAADTVPSDKEESKPASP